MAKKGDKKSKSEYSKEDIKLLMDNFILIQDVMTKTNEKLDSLSSHISKLLTLFELSAKSFVEKGTPTQKPLQEDKDMLEKINKLLEQNKTIARGLMLMEEKVKEKIPESSSQSNVSKLMPQFNIPKTRTPQFPPARLQNSQQTNQEMQPSITEQNTPTEIKPKELPRM